MEVTRNVILDLLPLYLAGEASADTVALVENYLEADPELAKIAQQAAATGLSEVPIPLSQEAAMEAYIKANQRMLMRTLALGALFIVVFVGIIALVMALIYGGFV
jgi:hypothetical protein